MIQQRLAGNTIRQTLQYSHWFNGEFTTVRTGYPPKLDIQVVPGAVVVSEHALGQARPLARRRGSGAS
jgi:hypothetical protein